MGRSPRGWPLSEQREQTAGDPVIGGLQTDGLRKALRPERNSLTLGLIASIVSPITTLRLEIPQKGSFP